jgi:DNA-binding PadR family transcriptional regulator
MYGYQITQRAKEITLGHLQITEGALYPILHQLEIDNIIQSEVQTINGRERKYYLLTEKGKRVQQNSAEEIKLYLTNLQNIFGDAF